MSLLEWLNPIGQVASGIGSLFSSGFNAISQAQTNKLNERLTRENWARQDSAYQRQVADLEKAGLNKALAYGSGGASSSTPLTMSAPQLDANSIAQGFSSLGSGAKGLTKEARELVREQYNFDKSKLGLTLESMANANNLQKVQEQLQQAKLSMQNMLNQFMAGELDLVNWEQEKAITANDYQTRLNLSRIDHVNSQVDYYKSKVNQQVWNKIASQGFNIDGKHYSLPDFLAGLTQLQYKTSYIDGKFTEKQLIQAMNWMSSDKIIDTIAKVFGAGGSLTDIVTAFDRMNQEHQKKSSSSTRLHYDGKGRLLESIIESSTHD